MSQSSDSNSEEVVFDPENMSVNQNPLQCFHYHSVGHRCGSPAMRGEYFCYHHRDSLKPTPIVVFPTAPFELPRLTDRASILTVADEIAYRIAANSIDLRRARSILSALYIAAAHLPPEPPQPSPRPAPEALIEIEIEHAIGPSEEVVPRLNAVAEECQAKPTDYHGSHDENHVRRTARRIHRIRTARPRPDRKARRSSHRHAHGRAHNPHCVP
ncbi:MAG TPA: hypothetical protein VG714_05995 [Acidobacteriaceae bacterium]|nr:hypothetical protein [Acidobacteriaceae bacterium]